MLLEIPQEEQTITQTLPATLWDLADGFRDRTKTWIQRL
jgi:hypothetical protein